MNKRFLLLFSILFVVSCSTLNRHPGPTPSAEDLDAEEQAVYSVLLSDTDRQQFVVSENTASGFEFRGKSDMPRGMRGLSRELWKNYLARNDRSYPLSNDMEIGVDYRLMDAEEMGDIFNNFEDGWEEFYNRYPESPGITTFSKVGFNSEGTEALVYMGRQLHYLAGTGNLIRLEKQDGVWKIVDQIMLWIS